MQPPFKPSELAMVTTSILDRGQYEQPEGTVALAGQALPDRRNPLYTTQAQSVGSMAAFMANRPPQARESSRDYEVLPGGQAVYFNDRAAKLVPFGPSDWKPDWGAHKTFPGSADTQDYRKVVRPPSSVAHLDFPEDKDLYGHDARVSTKLVGRRTTTGSY